MENWAANYEFSKYRMLSHSIFCLYYKKCVICLVHNSDLFNLEYEYFVAFSYN
jgi:hypothetical protein